MKLNFTGEKLSLRLINIIGDSSHHTKSLPGIFKRKKWKNIRKKKTYSIFNECMCVQSIPKAKAESF